MKWTTSKHNVLSAQTAMFPLAVFRVSQVLESYFDAKKLGADVKANVTKDFIRTYEAMGRKILISRDDWSIGSIEVLFSQEEDLAFIDQVKSQLETIQLWL